MMPKPTIDRLTYATFAGSYAVSASACFVAGYHFAGDVVEYPVYCIPVVGFAVVGMVYVVAGATCAARAWRAK